MLQRAQPQSALMHVIARHHFAASHFTPPAAPSRPRTCTGSTAAKPLTKLLKKPSLVKTGVVLPPFSLCDSWNHHASWHANLMSLVLREDLQEFRSRAAASATTRTLPASQIAVKEKDDSLYVPGASKQMSILSRLGIKVPARFAPTPLHSSLCICRPFIARVALCLAIFAHSSDCRPRGRAAMLLIIPPPRPNKARVSARQLTLTLTPNPTVTAATQKPHPQHRHPLHHQI
jgi:hypothetical protein